MLAGTYIYCIDPKSRLVIPACLRASLGEPVCLTAGPDATALLVPRGKRRRLHPSLTFYQPLDPTTGRVLLPAALREWTGLRAGAEAAVCGTGQAVVVLPWARCLAALRARRTEGAVPWHVPELAALWVENEALRRRVAREVEERAGALEKAVAEERERTRPLAVELARYRRVVGRLKT